MTKALATAIGSAMALVTGGCWRNRVWRPLCAKRAALKFTTGVTVRREGDSQSVSLTIVSRECRVKSRIYTVKTSTGKV